MQTPFSPNELAKFVGTEQWHRHTLNRKVLFTEGVKYVANRARAHWLIDEIALIQLHHERIAAEGFQVWNLQVNAARSAAQLVCEDGNGNVVYRKTISFTDFPGDGITLWFIDNRILLPTEY